MTSCATPGAPSTASLPTKDGTEGEFKLFGLAVDVIDLEFRGRYGEALFEKIGFKPEEPEFQLFSIDKHSAGFSRVEGDEMKHIVWRAKDRLP